MESEQQPSLTEKIAKLSGAICEAIEAAYGDEANVSAVAIIADVITDDVQRIVYLCNDPRKWVIQALLHEAADIAEHENTTHFRRIEGNDEDD